MPELGDKHECFNCNAKFYDLGKPEAICPKCGANQKDAKREEQATDSSSLRRRRREEVVRVANDEDTEIETSGDDEADDDEIEAPEGVQEEVDDVELDDDDD